MAMANGVATCLLRINKLALANLQERFVHKGRFDEMDRIR
jgi:hypothetical protein